MSASGDDARAQSQTTPYSTYGFWQDAGHQGVVGTHVAVMRDPEDDSTKVFLFGGSGVNQVMRAFAFKPGQNAVLPSSSNLIPVPHPAGDVTLLDLFCAGHVVLPDGRMLLVGGEAWSPLGIEQGFRFDPRYPSSSVTNPWTSIASMAQERWYPTLTVLPSGKVLANSGNMNTYMLSMGGEDSLGALNDSLHHLAVTNRSYWMSNSNAGTRPPARKDHGFIGDADRGIVFGGQGVSARLGDVWYMVRNSATDSSWSWQQMIPLSVATRGRPVARSRHTFTPKRNGTEIGGYVFGGRDSATGAAMRDLWYGRRPGGSANWEWTNLTPEPLPSNWPSARYGHAAVLDPGPPGSSRPRLLIFGGREEGGSLASNEVWAFDTVAAAFYRPPIGTPEGAPEAREGHVAIYESCEGACQRSIYHSTIPARRMTFFGGQGASSLLGDLWGLWRADLNPTDTTYTWDAMVLSGAQGTAPSGRTRMAGVYDQWGDRLLLFGGDTTSAGSPSGVIDTVVAFELRDAITSSFTRWNSPGMRTPRFASHNRPKARAGHAAMVDAQPRVARFPEVFDPSSGSAGSWVTAHVATNDPPKMELYPLMFVLRSGKVFHGGPRDHGDQYKYLFDPGTNLWDAATHSSNYSGSSAAMFKPGFILRGGTHSDGDRVSGDNKSDSVSFEGSATSGWHSINPGTHGNLGVRANNNLTLLPTGDVVATGGLSGTVLTSAYKAPRIWSATTGAWSGFDLNPDPHPRNYHSTAILLPDGRVLSTGGEKNNQDLSNDFRFRISVFEPPYLFDGNSLATRPSLTSPGLADTIGPSQRFTVCTPQAATISSVALVKPGAATHGFNQDQRYVPLAFTRVTGANPRLYVTAPPDVNHAPPGEYLLFVVDSAGVPQGKNRVPSVGRWMRMHPSAGLDDCDATRPGKVTALNACHDHETNTVNFEWVSPPEDSAVTGSGPGTAFSLRYSTSSISNETAWSNATEVSLGFVPGTEGGTHTKQLTLSDGTYYFRLRTRDDNGNWSAMSTQSTVEVPADPPTECFEGGGGGGGGGGSSARRGNGALSVLPGGGAPLSLPHANTLFPRPLRQGVTRDLSRLGADPSEGGSEAGVWVSSNPGVSMQVDEMRLLAVDHAEGREALVSEAGIVTCVVEPVGGVTLGDSVAASAEAAFALETGESATIDLGVATTLLLESARAGEAGRGQRNGVLVQVPRGGGWVTLRRVVPRRVAEPVAVAAGVTRVRLLALEDVRIERLGALTQVSAASPASLTMTSATGAAGADVAALLSAEDGERAASANGQAVSASFTVPEAAVGLTRSWFLSVAASFEGSSYGAFSRRGLEGPGAPPRFALHQNQPNPFTRSTGIAFDLPRGETVSLDVYDAAGRRMRTLASGWRPAGSHRVEWDQRDGHGALVRAGVYLYRLRGTASGVIERKLVVLP